ncbi:hypothetical protein K435DRAFT_909786 [Dendrothele bispora CBS 962.96]|uniref:BZIP domain-containing protein n=1 Tax=Dendrothele bispora (strain CBS 962.96) TaxID=1314807 RepID=A0A4S8LP15_DENBC|nr:hypothetical protein K435DRAFT_909786 [Dendrothele bispora CBS 962.96]
MNEVGCCRPIHFLAQDSNIGLGEPLLALSVPSRSHSEIVLSCSRKNVTPRSLCTLDAPTQTRYYATPSATSRKEMLAVFARERARAQAFGDEKDELIGQAPGPNATEREQIEWKRRQNTLAARKSRLEHQQNLENQVEDLKVEVEKWKTRSQTLEQILRSHGVPFFSFAERNRFPSW